MTDPAGYYRYDPDLDLDDLYAQGPDALFRELQKTRRLYEELNTVIEDSRDGIFVTDAKGTVIYMNKSYEKISGVSREEFIGRNILDMQGVTLDRSTSLAVMETGREITIEQFYPRTRRTAYATSTPVFNPSGELVMIIGNNRDFKEIEQLRSELENTRQLARQREEKIRAITSRSLDREEMLVADPKMYEILYTANKVAKTGSPILITGETGTGKEELARYIHKNSPRAGQSFITINCGAISPGLIESELFGYERGAFTGASASGKAGFFEVADQGTLFLDEIGEMPLDVQAKLLRALQNGEVIRVGGTRPIRVDVRIVAATNRDLREMVEKRLFREDLFYRLNVVEIRVPPLRDRKEDIIALADFFLKKANERHHAHKIFGQRMYPLLQGYEWPGNVRELRNLVEQLVIVSEEEVISPPDLLLYRPSLIQKGEEGDLNLKTILEQTEFEYIQRYYDELGSLRKVAEKLKVNPKTLSRRRNYLKARYG